MDQLIAHFLRLVSFDTRANPDVAQSPSSPGQIQLAKTLKADLESLGLQNIELDSNGYLTAMLSANTPHKVPAIGLIAHMDTAPDFSGKDVKTQIIDNYQGQEIPLGQSGEVLSVKQFPDLTNYIGDTLITTDGTTLLGADNKAGISAIIQALRTLKDEPSLRHGPLYIAFTPDEEISRGTDHFPLDRFPVEWAYTIDGGALGELEFENFNAATAIVRFQGNNVHPGTAKGIMINSQTLAARFHHSMPVQETPECTEDYEGFFHLIESKGSVEHTQLTYIIRDFDQQQFEARKKLLENKVQDFNTAEGCQRVFLELNDSYYNMREKVEPHPHIVAIAKEAMESLHIEPLIVPIRGGTDGSRLSYMGIPCPNIFTGGHNYHGKHEYISVQSMQKSVTTIVKIAELTAKKFS